MLIFIMHNHVIEMVPNVQIRWNVYLSHETVITHIKTETSVIICLFFLAAALTFSSTSKISDAILFIQANSKQLLGI